MQTGTKCPAFLSLLKVFYHCSHHLFMVVGPLQKSTPLAVPPWTGRVDSLERAVNSSCFTGIKLFSFLCVDHKVLRCITGWVLLVWVFFSFGSTVQFFSVSSTALLTPTNSSYCLQWKDFVKSLKSVIVVVNDSRWFKFYINSGT